MKFYRQTLDEVVTHMRELPFDANGCQIWDRGFTHSEGQSRYGVAYCPPSPGALARAFLAHRLSLQAHLGRDLKPGEFACHTCDNPPCVNPDHLWAGDNSQNLLDMYRKGRRPTRTRCLKGHEFAGDNLYISPRGRRRCRECDRIAWRARKAKAAA